MVVNTTVRQTSREQGFTAISLRGEAAAKPTECVSFEVALF
jgi:hypothetical protein